MEKAFELLEDDFKYMGDEAREVWIIVENLDYSSRRNNLQFKGLKKGAERENLVHFLENLFVACLGSDSTVEVKLKSARRLHNMRKWKKRVKDREILIASEDFSVKTAILDALWDKPKIVVKGPEITF